MSKVQFVVFVCVHVCLCMCMYFLLYCNAYLFHIIFVDNKSSYKLNKMKGDPLEIQHPKCMA